MPATHPLDLRQPTSGRLERKEPRPGRGEPQTPAPPDTWVPLSRSLRQHLRGLSGNAVKLYLLLLLSARFSGPHKGQVAASFADLALELGLHRESVRRAAQQLRPRYIVWKPARNQHSATLFTVPDYKTVADFAGRGAFPAARSSANHKFVNQLQVACNSTVASMCPACVQHVFSGAANSNNSSHLQSPKNEKNEKNERKKHALSRVPDPQLASELRVGLGPQLTTGRVKPEALERDRRRREAERQADLARRRANSARQLAEK